MKSIFHKYILCHLACAALILILHVPELSGQDTIHQVRGKVISAETGLPLADISIAAVNTSVEAVNTNINGEFTIKLPDKNEQIHVSYPGYKGKTIFVNGRTDILVSLGNENERSLRDPVTMSFREIPLRNIAASVDPGTSIDFNGSSASSFEQELSMKMTGLNVVNRSGMPGEGAFIHSRGFSSLLSPSCPLIVVDGMIVRSVGFSDPAISGFYSNPLSDIDKRDISGIVLLKDAASAGIYGVKSSDGVLLITTIPPRGGKTTLDVSVSGGIASNPRKIPVMDANHYSSYVMEQLFNSGLNISEIFEKYPFLEYDPDYLYKTRYDNNTQWQDEIFQNGKLYNAHLLVRGGDARAKYSLSGGYTTNESVIRNAGYTRFNFRFNSEVQVSSKVDIGFNLGYNNGKSSLMETGTSLQTNPILASLIKSPLLTVYQKDKDGLSLPVFDDIDDFGLSNPAVIVNKLDASNESSRFLGVSFLNLRITDDLTLRSQFGLDRLKSNEKLFIPSLGIAPQGDGSADRSMKVKVNQYYSMMGELRLNYSKKFSYIHDISMDAGSRYQINTLIQDFGAAQNSATDEFRDLNSGKADEKNVGGVEERWSWLNYYISANYILKDRYIITGILSLDASSKVGEMAEGGTHISGYPFAVLPSAGIAWRLSSEPFLEAITMLDELKVRASYGLTGSDNFQNYYTRLYYRSVPYYSITGFTLKGLFNPDLKWETVKKTNFGLDLGMLNERIMIRADWFESVTEDMVTTLAIPEYYGFDSYLDNTGSCINKGFEISAYARPISSRFRWETEVSWSDYENRVVRLKGGPIITVFTGGEKITREDSPMGQFWGYRSLGVIKSKEEADSLNLLDKSGRRFNAGDIQFADLDQNGIINELDKSVIGNPHPDYILGFANNFSFKGLTLEIFYTYVKGGDAFNYVRYKTESLSGIENQSTTVYKRWITDGQETDVPVQTFGDPLGNNRFSTRWIEDASFLRLKTITFSYTLPVKIAFINDINIYLTGTNLYTKTKYLGYDPEFSFADGIPGQGIDFGKIPVPKTMIIGLKLGL